MEGTGLQEEWSEAMGGVLLEDEFYIFYTFFFFSYTIAKALFLSFIFFVSYKVIEEEEDDDHLFIIVFFSVQACSLFLVCSQIR
jgi:xanthine/uracil/vitamin C permease (AzgA family)